MLPINITLFTAEVFFKQVICLAQSAFYALVPYNTYLQLYVFRISGEYDFAF